MGTEHRRFLDQMRRRRCAWRRWARRCQPDSNRRSGFCRPLPYHLAMAPCDSSSVYHHEMSRPVVSPMRKAQMSSAQTDARGRLLNAVRDRQDELIATIAELVRQPSVLGNEAGVQAIVARRLGESGMSVEQYDMPDDTPQQPNGGNSGVPFAGRPNVHGLRAGAGGGHSLILNGHVDVVSAEPVSAWSHDPWGAEVVGSRMYGRGAFDMKSGVGVNLFVTRLIND